MNIIWNKDELIKIKRIILNKTNYELNGYNNLVKNSNLNYFEDRFLKRDSFKVIDKKLEELFYIESREEVSNILNSLKDINADYNNPLHFGLIASLDKIDVEDYTYIFEIYNQIISQYSRVIFKACKEYLINLSSDEIAERINIISSSVEETELEIQIKITMDKILSYVPQLKLIPIYNSLIDANNTIIKEKILISLNSELSKTKKHEEYQKNVEYKNHVRNFSKKYQRDNMGTLKRNYSKFY